MVLSAACLCEKPLGQLLQVAAVVHLDFCFLSEEVLQVLKQLHPQLALLVQTLELLHQLGTDLCQRGRKGSTRWVKPLCKWCQHYNPGDSTKDKQPIWNFCFPATLKLKGLFVFLKTTYNYQDDTVACSIHYCWRYSTIIKIHVTTMCKMLKLFKADADDCTPVKHLAEPGVLAEFPFLSHHFVKHRLLSIFYTSPYWYAGMSVCMCVCVIWYHLPHTETSRGGH